MSRRRALLSNKGVTPSGHGSGTQNDPFLIFTVDDLLMMRNVLAQESARLHSDYYGIPVNYAATGQYFKLMADLDLSSICGPGIGNFFGTGDGQLYTTLAGDFNGNNHKISNMYDTYATISASDWSKRCGLFYQLIAGGRCHHLVVENIIASGRYAGVIPVNRGTVDHCKVLSGTITGFQGFGGICGWVGDGGIIDNCENNASVINSSYTHTVTIAGCIAGYYGNNASISNCINYADFSFNSGTRNNVGGLLGGMAGSSQLALNMYNNINFGNFFCNSNANGGIAGCVDSGTIQRNIYAGNMTSSGGTSGAILGRREGSRTINVYGNLNLGTTHNASNNIYPINYAGTNSSSYPNYFITEFNKYTATKTGVVASTSSNLICTADNTRPPAITNTSFWTTDNFVFKKGYYPYPKGIENTDACLCAATPVILASGNTYNTVSSTVQLGTIESYLDGITWTTSSSSIMRIDVAHDNSSEMDYYVGVPVSTGQVTLTNWKNGKAYKKVNLTITGTI